MKKIAVVLLNLGGPDSQEAVEPFLYNLFCDPDIFKIPIGQKLFAKIISKRRAPKVAHEYGLIGGKSPLNEYTEQQRKLLENELRTVNPNIDVIVAMRYWNPLTAEIAQKVEKGNYDKIVLLPLYPHFSVSTTGSSFNEWKRCYKGDPKKVVYIDSYFDHPKYLAALNQRIDETLLKFPEELRNDVHILFSAHGTPVSMVKGGDPYSIQIQKTVEETMKMRNHSHKYHLSFQSKVGPVRWLEPATDDMIKDLKLQGVDNLLVVPVSFVSDHIETLFELDIEYREVADEVKMKNYIMMPGLNDSELFISCLKNVTLKSIGIDN